MLNLCYKMNDAHIKDHFHHFFKRKFSMLVLRVIEEDLEPFSKAFK